MKNVIICEGSTDLTLIQYFLEKVHNWEYIDKKEHREFEDGIINKINNCNYLKWFKHENGNIMAIIAAGGVSKIKNVLESVLDLNKLGTIKAFDKIIIISDRDEIKTEQDFIDEMGEAFSRFGVNFNEEIINNHWNTTTYMNDIQDERCIEFLPLIIPFEDTGSIEIFLLNALCKESEENDPLKVDKHVIEQCVNFIDNIDCKGKYLRRRRHITKAKFDTVFVVMTPAEAFSQRQTLLRNIPWEDYKEIQVGFKKLDKLLEKK